MVSRIEYYYKKIELSENEAKVFLALDRYKNREIKRWVILNELGWGSIKAGLLSKIIKKFVNEGLFKVRFRYNKGVHLEIVPLYDYYKIISCNGKKVLWLRFKYR